MTTLTGKKPKNTYKDLLQVSNNNGGIDSTLRAIEDGEGSAGALKLSASQVSVAGNELVLDADGDSSITADTDDRIDFRAGGADIAALTPAGLLVGDVADADIELGLTVNKGSSTKHIAAFKSAGTSHGMTDLVETDTFGSVADATEGGLQIEGYAAGAASTALFLYGVLETPQSSDTTTSKGVIRLAASKKSGAGAGDLAANENVIVFMNNGTTHFLMKGNGDLHASDTTIAALDVEDDAALLRAIDLDRAQRIPEIKTLILPSRFDANRYPAADLVRLGLRTEECGEADAAQPLFNVSQQARAVRGAIWQTHEMVDALIEALAEALGPSFRAAVREKLVARGLPTAILDWDAPVPSDWP